MTDFFRAAVTCYKNALSFRFTAFIDLGITSAVKLNNVLKGFILRNKPDRNKKTVKLKLPCLPCRILNHYALKLIIADKAVHSNSENNLNIIKLFKLFYKLLFARKEVEILNYIYLFCGI